MSLIQFVPWRYVSNWKCSSCGSCCKDYSVVLSFAEWLTIARTFGVNSTFKGLDKFFIRRLPDGACGFLCEVSGLGLCGLQNMKPAACKLWPFKVLFEPKYGDAKQAAFDFYGKRLYIYADSNCAGLRLGTPVWEFYSFVLREFAEVALGLCKSQRSSTRSCKIFRLQRF
jgi:Fe-S-cluster containining protein